MKMILIILALSFFGCATGAKEVYSWHQSAMAASILKSCHMYKVGEPKDIKGYYCLFFLGDLEGLAPGGISDEPGGEL